MTKKLKAKNWIQKSQQQQKYKRQTPNTVCYCDIRADLYNVFKVYLYHSVVTGENMTEQWQDALFEIFRLVWLVEDLKVGCCWSDVDFCKESKLVSILCTSSSSPNFGFYFKFSFQAFFTYFLTTHLHPPSHRHHQHHRLIILLIIILNVYCMQCFS